MTYASFSDKEEKILKEFGYNFEETYWRKNKIASSTNFDKHYE